MAGQIINRGDGKWLLRVFMGRDANGKRIYRNRTVEGNKKAAQKVLDQMRDECELGPGFTDKLLVAALLDDLVKDYRINGKSVDWCEMVVRVHLRPHFGAIRASRVTTPAARDYIDKRQKEGAANATINREISLLRRAFYLGFESTPPIVARVPKFPRLEENNVRKGFFEDEQYRALLAELPEYLKPVLTFAYFTGCRRGEILSLQWSQVDLIDGIIRLEPGETKNEESRIIPLVAELREALAARKVLRDASYPKCPWVFFNRGERLLSIKNAWERSCKRAGLVTEDGKHSRIFHDLRRTGVRNLVRAGVPEKVAQTISGHKTRAVFERYNITNEDDLKDAAKRLQEYTAKRRNAEREHTAAHSPENRHTVGTQKAEDRPN